MRRHVGRAVHGAGGKVVRGRDRHPRPQVRQCEGHPAVAAVGVGDVGLGVFLGVAGMQLHELKVEHATNLQMEQGDGDSGSKQQS